MYIGENSACIDSPIELCDKNVRSLKIAPCVVRLKDWRTEVLSVAESPDDSTIKGEWGKDYRPVCVGTAGEGSPERRQSDEHPGFYRFYFSRNLTPAHRTSKLQTRAEIAIEAASSDLPTASPPKRGDSQSPRPVMVALCEHISGCEEARML